MPRNEEPFAPACSRNVPRYAENEKYKNIKEGTMDSVLIVDDHPLFREGLKGALEASGAFGCIMQAGLASDALAILNGPPEKRPSIVLLDINLPDGSGLDLLERYTGLHDAPRFLMLSMYADRAIVLKAIIAGAHGYASKQIPLEALILGIKLVAADQLFIESELLRDILTPRQLRTKDEALAKELIRVLSPRELDTFSLLAKGDSPKEIAAALGVSVRTVENYQSCVYAKLGFRSPVDLVRLALHAGIIEP
jgi:two-component system, NarL family, nitrate/nitrite response regulator NarL